MRLLLRWLLLAATLLGIAYYFPGIEVSGIGFALLIVVVFGLINAIIGGILKLLTLPLNILTLGVLGLLINGLMFWFTSSILDGFVITGFLNAFWGSLAYTIAGTVINWLVKDRD